jgi:hypothetical protein
MGQISRFDLDEMCQMYNISTYVETGTGIGESLSFALLCKRLKLFHSIEIDHKLYRSNDLLAKLAKCRSSDQQVYLHKGESTERLEAIIKSMPEGPAIFFLDAHFPGSDFFGIGYDESIANAGVSALPLLLELAVLKLRRKGLEKDVIVIDDLMLFENGTYEMNYINDEMCQRMRSILTRAGLWIGGDFSAVVNSLIGGRTRILRYYEDQGYLVIYPHL